MVTEEKKELEYPEAPSGFVTLYNYKEPFMPFQDPDTREGYGYQGVLVFDGETDKVQCHLCGSWHHALGGHLSKEHNMRAADYKNLVGLSKNTALIGEAYRAKLIANGKSRFNNLRLGGKHTEASKRKISETLRKETREYQNLRGTCPVQLLDRLEKKAQELGRCPTTDEITFTDTIRKVYGSFTVACKMAGLTPLKSGQTLKKTKYTVDYYIPIVRDFWIKHHKLPKMKDFRNKNEFAKYGPLKKEIVKKVMFGEGQFHKTPVRIHYDKNELLSLIKIFKDKNQREPSTSDCKRGLLPHASTYYYHFGSLKKALELVNEKN